MVLLVEQKDTNVSVNDNEPMLCRNSVDLELKQMAKTEKSENFIPPNMLQTKVFKRRWLELALFVLQSALTNSQWFQYTIITNIVKRYYGVSSLVVEWTSLIFLVMYLILLVPASYLMNRVGLRWTVLIAGTGTCLGAWIKVFSASPDRFVVTFIGQITVAASQIFVLTVPGQLATRWFGLDQVATATAIACFGMQIGLCACTVITTMIVKNHEDIEEIGKNFFTYFLLIAIASTVIYILVILFFQDEPRLPPSDSRALQKLNNQTVDTKEFWQPIKRVLRNKSFVLLWNIYGINLGSIAALTAFMNPFYLAHFKNSEEEAGRLVFFMSMMGAVAATVFALILDKTKKFKAIAIFVCVFAAIAEILFSVSLIMEIKWLVVVSVMLLGTCTAGFGAIGIEFCVETTYPEPEGISIGILSVSSQIYGIIIILVCGRLIEAYGDTAGYAWFCALFIISMIISICNKIELRRQNAGQKTTYETVPVHILQSVKSDISKKP